MAGKKNSRTSKTDHVLSLLAGGAPPSEPVVKEPSQTPARQETQAVTAPEPIPEPVQPSAQPEAAVQTAAPAVPLRRTAAPILEVARVQNEALSETIREALTESLEQELAAQAPEPAAEPQPLPVEDPEPVLQPDSQPQSELQEESEPQPLSEPAAEPQPQMPPAPTPTGPGTMLEDGSVYVNVMEELVGEPIEKYVKMFGLCTCQRCLCDVRALTLSRLPAKYVVLSGNAMTPMMSFYQAKFESAVIAQVIQACKAVMEHPRHIL